MKYVSLNNNTGTTARWASNDLGSSVNSMTHRLRLLHEKGVLAREEQEALEGGNEWIYRLKVVTPAKGEPMPRTVEYYKANAIRDQELILAMKAQISRLKQKINKLKQTVKKDRIK